LQPHHQKNLGTCSSPDLRSVFARHTWQTSQYRIKNLLQPGAHPSIGAIRLILRWAGIFTIAIIISKFSIFAMDDAFSAFIFADLPRAQNCFGFCPGMTRCSLCMRLLDIPATFWILYNVSFISRHIVF
jgi:hypothetical protein